MINMVVLQPKHTIHTHLLPQSKQSEVQPKDLSEVNYFHMQFDEVYYAIPLTNQIIQI